MALEIFWGSGSPFAWTVLLACEFKKQPYESHVLQFSKQEHKSPEMMAMNPRGKVPVLRDGKTVVYESIAIVQYLDKKFPNPPLFGETPEQTAKVWQVISEFQSYMAKPMIDTVRPFLFGKLDGKDEEIKAGAKTTHEELAFFCKHYLSKTPWLVGEKCSAADLVVYPTLQLFRRGLEKQDAQRFDLGFLPLEEKFAPLGAWQKRIEALPGFDKTYPPHWRA